MNRKTHPIKTIVDYENAQTYEESVWDEGALQNAECYGSDTPCPACKVGIIFGADFPNGDGDGNCLNCGKPFHWNEDLSEWLPGYE